MLIRFLEDGTAQAIYSEEIDLKELGKVKYSRASHVEPNEQGEWIADLTPIQGPMLGPFKLRSETIKSEILWLENNILSEPKPLQ
jgi:hypothetical protein